LLSHGFVVAGYLIVVALTRPALAPGRPPADRRGPPWRWRATFDPPERPGVRPPLRLVDGQARYREKPVTERPRPSVARLADRALGPKKALRRAA
jgi:hypothetical protein